MTLIHISNTIRERGWTSCPSLLLLSFDQTKFRRPNILRCSVPSNNQLAILRRSFPSFFCLLQTVFPNRLLLLYLGWPDLKSFISAQHPSVLISSFRPSSYSKKRSYLRCLTAIVDFSLLTWTCHSLKKKILYVFHVRISLCSFFEPSQKLA